MRKLRILFMGTPDFSSVVLEKLAAAHEVTAVVTGLDKPVGRGYELRPSPVKVTAEKLGIPVLQFEKVSRDGIDAVSALSPDLGVTAAFGQILSERFLSLFPFGVINVHASLLPKYRGASPIQWAVLNGDKTTGVTVMRTVKEVDAGDILLQEETEIGAKETAGELFDRLALLGGDALVKAVGLIESGRAVYVPQDHSLATRCGMIGKEDGKARFDLTPEKFDCFVRGMTPWPSAWMMLEGKRVKILSAERAEGSGAPGEVLKASAKEGLVVACGDGAVRLTLIQPEGKGRMTDTAWLAGHKISAGVRIE